MYKKDEYFLSVWRLMKQGAEYDRYIVYKNNNYFFSCKYSKELKLLLDLHGLKIIKIHTRRITRNSRIRDLWCDLEEK